MTMTVGFIVGSLSETSINRKLANILVQLAPAEVRLAEIPIGTLPLFNRDRDMDLPPEVRDLKAAIASVDAILFVTPEYNRSIPGVLKNAIDWASRPRGDNSFHDKPSAVIGASVGAIGTALGQHALRAVLNYCGSPQFIDIEAYIHFTSENFASDGTVPSEDTREFLRSYMQGFHGFTARMIRTQATT